MHWVILKSLIYRKAKKCHYISVFNQHLGVYLAILITGGAGFVGSSMAYLFREKFPQKRIVCFDNLKRRGSELNLSKFKALDIEFVHGDVRHLEDLLSIDGNFDLMLEASAEPSVHAGVDGDVKYLLDTNLYGTINCLEFAKKKVAKTIFLSTSRVYSIEALREIPLIENKTRFEIDSNLNEFVGLSQNGINEEFETKRYRSLYGTTKLSSEMLIQEYCQNFNMDLIVNRCGVIAGRGQWGKVDQGVFTLWVANHFFKKNLKYTGFGGTGKQVRDLIHPSDLFNLILKQFEKNNNSAGQPFNVGGGLASSTSMCELTSLCQEVTGNQIQIDPFPETNKMDIPLYISDNSKVSKAYDWNVIKNSKDIVIDIYEWLSEEKELLKNIFN